MGGTRLFHKQYTQEDFEEDINRVHPVCIVQEEPATNNPNHHTVISQGLYVKNAYAYPNFSKTEESGNIYVYGYHSGTTSETMKLILYYYVD